MLSSQSVEKTKWSTNGRVDTTYTSLFSWIGCCFCCEWKMNMNRCKNSHNCTTHLLFLVNRALMLAIIVEKSKKCLDFSVTLFIIHIIFCSMYGGFPSTWDWWIIHILGMILMVVLGEYLCSKKELSDIPLLVLWGAKFVWFLPLYVWRISVWWNKQIGFSVRHRNTTIEVDNTWTN